MRQVMGHRQHELEARQQQDDPARLALSSSVASTVPCTPTAKVRQSD
jgi:hypothetical protein